MTLASAAARPQPFSTTTLTAWNAANGKAYPEKVFGDTPDAAAAAYANDGSFGNTLLILERNTLTGRQMLHTYRIRRGAWKGRHDEQFKRIYPYYADKLFAVEVTAFSPVEPWKWTPGCDPVGHADPDIIDRLCGRVG